MNEEQAAQEESTDSTEERSGEEVSTQKTSDKEVKKKSGGLLGLLVAAILVLGGFFLMTKMGGGQAAIVYGESISKAEYNQRVKYVAEQWDMEHQMGFVDIDSKHADAQAFIRHQAMDALVGEKLILREAKNSGIAVSDEEVEQVLQETKQSYASEEVYKEELKANGITENELRRNIFLEMTIVEYLAKVLPQESYEVTDEELEEAYQFYLEDVNGFPEEERPEVLEFEDFKETYRSHMERQKMFSGLPGILGELREEAEREGQIKILVSIPELPEMNQGEGMTDFDLEALLQQSTEENGEGESENGEPEEVVESEGGDE